MKPLDILWLTWLLIPVGVGMILLSGKSRRTAIVGALFCVASILYILRYPEAFGWQFDLIRGWSVEIPVQAGDFQVVLEQKPGVDFYDTSLRILRADGHEAEILIDGDSGKWVNPRVLCEGATCWILADNMPRARAPMIDTTSGVVSVQGWSEGVFRLAELAYADPSRRSGADAP